MLKARWEYCLLTCTPMSGVDEAGIRLVGQISAPDGVKEFETHSDDTSSLGAIGHLLNELGEQGWELIAYDTTTNRGVFKRAKT